MSTQYIKRNYKPTKEEFFRKIDFPESLSEFELKCIYAELYTVFSKIFNSYEVTDNIVDVIYEIHHNNITYIMTDDREKANNIMKFMAWRLAVFKHTTVIISDNFDGRNIRPQEEVRGCLLVGGNCSKVREYINGSSKIKSVETMLIDNIDNAHQVDEIRLNHNIPSYLTKRNGDKSVTFSTAIFGTYDNDIKTKKEFITSKIGLL